MNLASSLWDATLGAVTFLLVITVLVAVHELGHFLFARLFKMEVKAFAVMMGGIRKTSLHSRLAAPLAPAWAPVGLGVFATALLLLGLGLSNEPIEVAGLLILALPLPIWIALRLEKLYHLDPWTSLRTMGLSYAGGLLLLFFGTRGAGLTPPFMLGVLIASGLVGVLILYYKPLSQKAEDSEMGHGMIQAAGQPVPVLFRPLLWWTDRKGTEFSLLLLPLGGFAAIKGMHAKEDGSEIHIPGGFYSRPAWQRLIVLFAGPFFSIAFGILLLWGKFVAEGQEGPIPTTIVREVASNSPAAKAGIRPGDKIVAINGKETSHFFELASAIRDRLEVKGTTRVGIPTTVLLERDAQKIELQITPRISQRPKPVVDLEGNLTGKESYQAELGIVPVPVMVPLAPLDALGQASMAPIRMVGALASLLSRPETAKEAVGGPISIAQASTTAAKQGVSSVILMAALLSITLGIMNLLPIPPLDGGQMVVAFVEMLRGEKRLGIGLQQGLSTFGLLFVIGLTLLAFAVDLGRQGERNQAPKTQSSPRP